MIWLCLDDLKTNQKSYNNLLNSAFWGWLSMESQPKNPEFRTNAENFHPCSNIQADGRPQDDVEETDRERMLWVEAHNSTPDRRQSKTLSTIDEWGSKIDRNSVFHCHLSPVGCQIAIKNTVSIDFWSTFFDSIGIFDCRLPGVNSQLSRKEHLEMLCMQLPGGGQLMWMMPPAPAC